MKLKWMSLALNDLSATRRYINRDNPSAARQVIQHIRKTAREQLPHNPYIGRVGRLTGTRKLVITKYPYILVYQVNENRVEILRVMHTARHWPE